ncbi:MAG: PfkB family carbohydrate kinase [Pseudomonadota bacterium]
MPVCLSVQSLVVSGAVGHGAAAFTLAAEGIEVWPLPTVVLSAHAATPGVRGERLGAGQVASLVDGLQAHGLGAVDAVLLGYLGSVEVAGSLGPLLAGGTGTIVLCDPVLGDDGKLYLPEAMIEVYRTALLPHATIATPNVDELGWLTEMPTQTIPQIIEAARTLRDMGPEVVHVTSVPAPRQLGILTVSAEGAWLTSAPKAPLRVNGAGDFVAALLLAGALQGEAPEASAARAVAATGALAQEALRLGRDTLPVVPAARLWQAGRHRAHPTKLLT